MWTGKKAAWAVLHGIARLLPRAPRMTVLLYHSVSNADDFFSVTPEVFKQQLVYLAKKAQIVPLARAFEHAQGNPVTTDSVAITFDDGYQDLLTTAVPLLAQEQMSSTVFVLGENPIRSELENELPLLSETELRKLATDWQVEIGSHALSHRKLTKLNPEDLHGEVRGSRERIRTVTGTVPAFLAYPKGAFNETTKAAVREAGYLGAVSVVERGVHVGDDIYALPRVQVDSTTTLPVLGAKVSLAADWYYAIWSLTKRLRG